MNFDWKFLYTVFDGRINRKPYWLGTLGLLVAVMILYGLIFSVLGIASIIPIIILSLATLYPSFALIIKRLHDRNKSGWWSLVFYIPSILSNIVNATMPGGTLAMICGLLGLIAAIWLLVEVGFLKGTDGPNDYGPDPLAGQR